MWLIAPGQSEHGWVGVGGPTMSHSFSSKGRARMKPSVKKRGGFAGGPGRIPDPRKLGCAHKGLGSRMCARVGWVGWVGWVDGSDERGYTTVNMQMHKEMPRWLGSRVRRLARSVGTGSACPL